MVNRESAGHSGEHCRRYEEPHRLPVESLMGIDDAGNNPVAVRHREWVGAVSRFPGISVSGFKCPDIGKRSTSSLATAGHPGEPGFDLTMWEL